jgi:hypothetical protein
MISRLPSESQDSYKYSATAIKGILPSIYTKPSLSGMDPLISVPNGLVIGSGSTSERGRYDITVSASPTAEYDAGTSMPSIYYEEVLGLIPYKVFQSYIVRDSLTGRLYLAVISSTYSSKESNPSTNPYGVNDVVDLFELRGRILTRVMA